MNKIKVLLPWLAVAIFVAVFFVWPESDRKIHRQAFTAYSVHNTSPEGLSLAYAYLQRQLPGTRIDTISRPLERANLDAQGILFRIAPDSDVPPGLQRPDPKALGWGLARQSSDEDQNDDPPTWGTPLSSPVGDDHPAHMLTREEESWIRSGGTMILALAASYATLKVESVSEGNNSKTFPIWKGIHRLEPPTRHVLSGDPLRETHTLWSLQDKPLIARATIGEGSVILFSCPEIFQNESIEKAQHLELLTLLAGGGRPVYFDEYVHGLRSKAGVVEILSNWGWGPLILLLLLTVLVLFWRKRTRIGPPEDDYEESRVEAIDFVDSLALLYNRSLRRSDAIVQYHTAFVQSVAAQTGLRGPALEKKKNEILKRTIQTRTVRGRDISVSDFLRDMKAINDAFGRLEDAKHSRVVSKAGAAQKAAR